MAAKLSICERPTRWALAMYFLRLGTIGFGGPIALAARMQRDLVDSRRWISQEEYLEGLAIAQLTPGPLAAQLAMYLGFLLHGITGATIVAVAFIAPSFLIVLALAHAYVRYGGLPWMQNLFYGVGAAVIGIIAHSSWKLMRRTLKHDALLWMIFGVLAVSTAITEREIVGLFLASGIVTLLVRNTPARFRLLMGSPILVFPRDLVSNRLVSIFAFFAKAGLFVFGSGLAIVPFLHGGVVLEKHWLTEKQFVDAVAVAIITPGPVVITVAFIGYLVGGTTGALAAAMGVFLPIYLVVIVGAPLYRRYSNRKHIRAFVEGVTAAAIGAIAGAVVVLAHRSIHDLPTLTIGLGAFLFLLIPRIPEPVVVAIAALAGFGIRTFANGISSN